MPIFASAPSFIWSANENGLAVRFSDSRRFTKAKQNRASETDQMAFIRMQMLLECGQAEAWNVDDGIFITSPDAVRLDKDTRENFSLPPSWPGGMRLQTNSVPQLNGFHAHLGLVYPGSILFWDWRLHGPVLEAGGSHYLPTAAQYTALKAYKEWINASQKDEFTNLCLLAALREAKDAGLHIDLEAYQETQVATADDIYLDAREDLSSGDLILRPVLTGSFPDIDPDKIEERLAQFEPNVQHSILRVGSTIVLLPPKLAVQAQAVASRGRVPKIKRKEFERNPEKWLAENVFPDVETEFSPRVTGIGIWKGGYLYAEWDDGQDWFGKQPSLEQSPEIKKTKASAGDNEEKTDQLSDIDTDIQTDLPPVVPLIIPNDTELEFGWRFPELAKENTDPFQIDFTRYAMTPLPHQEEADKTNLLIQCKSTTQNQLNSEISIREVEGARPFYEQALGITFNEKCVHTTAKKVSKRTQRAGEICGITIHCRSWLAEMLNNKKIKKSEIIAANSNRKKI